MNASTYRILIDSSADSFVITRNGLIESVNPAVLELFGTLEEADCIGKRLSDWIDTSMGKELTNKEEQSIYKAPTSLGRREFSVSRKDRASRIVDVQISVIQDKEDEVSLYVMREITNQDLFRKELDLQNKKLHELNTTLNQAQKLSHVGSWKWNMATDEAEWSDEMYRIYGVTKENFYPSNKNVTKTVIPEDLPKLEKGVESLLKNQIFEPFEFRIKRPSGEIRNVYIIALELGEIGSENENIIFGVTQDITKQKQIEEDTLKAKISLGNIEKALNNAQKLAQIGSWLYDIESQKIEWSEEMFHIWGFDLEQGAPDFESMVERIHTDDRDLFLTYVNKAIHQGTPYEIEHRICLPNLDQKIVIAICQPVLDIQGEVVSLAGTSQDITELKKTEEKIRKSLKEKEILLRELYHRTKNNMQVISSMLSMRSLYSQNEEIKNLLDETKNKILGMALVHEKLYQSNDLSRINLKIYLIELVELLKNNLLIESANIVIVTAMEEVNANIDTAIPCGLIVNELFTNAVKHAFPDGRKGTIKIQMKKTERDEILISVTDDGIGFPDSIDLKNTESYGLEAIVMLSELQLGGSLELEKKEGTRFTLAFKETLNADRI